MCHSGDQGFCIGKQNGDQHSLWDVGFRISGVVFSGLDGELFEGILFWSCVHAPPRKTINSPVDG